MVSPTGIKEGFPLFSYPQLTRGFRQGTVEEVRVDRKEISAKLGFWEPVLSFSSEDDDRPAAARHGVSDGWFSVPLARDGESVQHRWLTSSPVTRSEISPIAPDF